MLTHNKEKLYACSQCGWRFNLRSDLTRHERTHTGEKPYVCSQCGYATTQAGALTEHKIAHPQCGEAV